MGHWWQAANALDAKLKALKGHEAVPGVTLDWAKATVSGFPFRLDVTFDGFAAHGQGPHGPFAWRSAHFALHALTYGAEKTVFEAAGDQHLSWADPAGAAHSADFLPGSLRASAVRDAGALVRFDVDIVELDGKGFSIGRAQFHMRRDPDGKSLDLMAEADLAKASGPLGAVRNLRTYQTLSQANAFSALLRGAQGAAAAHAAWEKAGGRMIPAKLEINGRAASLPLEQVIAAGALLAPLY
jgi:hypothetical protein